VVVETHNGGDVRVLLPKEGGPPPEKVDKWILVAPERLPPTRFGWLDVLEAAGRLELWNTAWNLMNYLGAALKEKGCGAKVIAALACKVWLHVARQEPITLARHIEPETDELSPLSREVAATELTGWMRARTSLARNKRLGELLAEGGGRPEDELMQELPGAVLAEWPHWRQGGAEGIARRVFSSARMRRRPGPGPGEKRETGGRGARRGVGSRRARRIRAGRGPCEAGTSRDAAAAAPATRRLGAGGLSPQQTAVWQLMRRGMERAEIAAELGIPKGQISVVLHNAVKKVSEARKAAGL
jgi:DNA-binding CsgD family transcriptional regulator